MLEDIKSKGDAVLKSQVEQAADMKKVAQDVRSLRSDVSAIGELVKSAASGGDLADEYTNEINEIRDLIDAGHPKIALDRLETLEKRLKPDVAAIIRFRIITNKAASLAALAEEEKAALLFIERSQRAGRAPFQRCTRIPCRLRGIHCRRSRPLRGLRQFRIPPLHRARGAERPSS